MADAAGLQGEVFLTIVLAAIVTYTLRVGGLLLAERFPKTGRFKKFMDALPGTILLSLIVPGVFGAGIWGWAATACTAFCSLKTGNVFASMTLGVGIVALGRWFAG
jgi:uncharacterized membrane protein